MELISEFPTRLVEDWTLHFVGGAGFTVTISPESGETVDEGFDIIITKKNDAGALVETNTILRRNLLFYSRKLRTEVVYPVGQSPLEKEIALQAQAAKPFTHRR